MLDIRLEDVSFRGGRGGREISGIDIRFDRNTHTALIGPPGGGKTTLLRLIAGAAAPARGLVLLGTRDVTTIRASRRPILAAGTEPLYPARWSVAHWLLAALRTRTLDREDRMRELEIIRSRWKLAPLLERKVRHLSSGETVRLRLAVIEALHPAILIAERVLEGSSPAEAPALADQLYRVLRVMGTTVVSEVSDSSEAGHCDRVVVIAGGRIEQSGIPKEVFERPVSPAAAAAAGPCNLLEVQIRDGRAISSIGEWDAGAVADGEAIAMIRPGDFAVARKGEDSDLIFGIEEAGFWDGHWHLRGFITGGSQLQVSLQAQDLEVHKGRLLPLRIAHERIVLFPRASE